MKASELMARITQLEYTGMLPHEIAIAFQIVDSWLATSPLSCISIWDSEDWAIENERGRMRIVEAMNSSGSDHVHLLRRDPARPHAHSREGTHSYGWIWFIYGNGNYGLDVITDYSANEVTEKIIERATSYVEAYERYASEW